MPIRSIRNKGIPKSGRLRLPTTMPNLSLLGVPESMQNRSPMVGSYPDKFNQDVRWIWKKMFEKDENFKEQIRAESRVDLQWHMAIVYFLDLCEKYGAIPFANVTNQEQTDAVISSLSSARRALKNYIDGIGLFERVKVREACREYHIKERGTAILSWAYLRNVRDPQFEKWLVQKPNPGLVMSTAMKYTRMIQPNVLFWVRYVNSTRVTVGFEIQVASPVSIPGKRLATRKDIDTFVDRAIWLPIIRAHRFKGLKLRLF